MIFKILYEIDMIRNDQATIIDCKFYMYAQCAYCIECNENCFCQFYKLKFIVSSNLIIILILKFLNHI